MTPPTTGRARRLRASAYRRAVDAVPMPVRRSVRYRGVHGRFPSLTAPRTFSEKVTWRMLRDRRPLLAITCDKLAMQDHARATAGDVVRVPRTLWSGTDVADLAATLATGPDGVRAAEQPRWVLKPNHRSGLVEFGRGVPDVAALRARTAGWLDRDEWVTGGEWAYSQARALLLAEERIGGPDVELTDHKFYVFDGRVRMVQVDTRRFTAHGCRMYSPDWEYLGATRDYPAGDPVPRPALLAAMVAAAERIGAGFDFLRVDLYEHDGEIWFGEITPYPGSGLVAWEDPALDARVGAWWRLPR